MPRLTRFLQPYRNCPEGTSWWPFQCNYSSRICCPRLGAARRHAVTSQRAHEADRKKQLLLPKVDCRPCNVLLLCTKASASLSTGKGFEAVQRRRCSMVSLVELRQELDEEVSLSPASPRRTVAVSTLTKMSLSLGIRNFRAVHILTLQHHAKN